MTNIPALSTRLPGKAPPVMVYLWGLLYSPAPGAFMDCVGSPEPTAYDVERAILAALLPASQRCPPSVLGVVTDTAPWNPPDSQRSVRGGACHHPLTMIYPPKTVFDNAECLYVSSKSFQSLHRPATYSTQSIHFGMQIPIYVLVLKHPSGHHTAVAQLINS